MFSVPSILWLGYKNPNEMPAGCGNKFPDESQLLKPADSAGKVLFQANCASCHHPLKDAVGPALKGILTGRDFNFLYLFLTKRNKVKNDKLVQAHKKIYIFNCMEFRYLTKVEVRNLEAFIHDYAAL